MKFNVVVILQITFLLQLSAQQPKLEWASQIGGNLTEAVVDITSDLNGNIVCVGHFQDTVDFDPGQGILNYGSKGLSDMFIQKLDTSGNLLWAYTFGDSKTDVIASVCTDSKGSIYLAGSFYGTIDFDPGPGLTILHSSGTGPLGFLMKLSRSGQLIWIEPIGDSLSFEGNYTLTTDYNDNAYLALTLRGNIRIGSNSKSVALASQGLRDIFIVKFDSIGTPVSTHRIGSSGVSEPLALSADAAGNLMLLGKFSDTLKFNSINVGLTPAVNSNDYFIMKISHDGSLAWVRQTNTSLQNNWLNPKSIGFDQFGNVYVAGVFSNTVDLNLGPSTVLESSHGDADGFLIKLNSIGDYLSHYTFGGQGLCSIKEIVCDKHSNVYCLGAFEGSADFDPGPSTAVLNSKNFYEQDIFQLKLNSNGNLVYLNQLGNSNYMGPLSICIDPWFNLVTAGVFTGDLDVDPDTSSLIFSSFGAFDAFVQKLAWQKPLMAENLSFEFFGAYPNPSTGKISLWLEDSRNVKVHVYNTNGLTVWESTNSLIEIDISNHVPGIYIIEVEIDEVKHRQKILKI